MIDFCPPWALRTALALVVVSPLVTPAFEAPTLVARQAPPQRVVAVGDVHGAYEGFVEILQTAGLVDAKLRWTRGATVFVQTGDIFDRGPKVREALDLLIRLEDEARRAGGRLEFLLGNHETMNIFHEFRDASPAAYAGFADSRSEARRQRAFEDYVRLVKRRATPGEAPPVRDAWMATHPPGFLEYVDAIGPRGKYGRWLRAHKVVTTVGRTAFMHAGINSGFTGTFDDINRTAAREIAEWDATLAAMVKAQIVPVYCTLPEAVEAAVAELQRISAALQANAPPGDHVTKEFVEQLQALLAIGKSSLFEPEGPLWFRGFAQWPDTPETVTGQLTPLLTRFGVDRFVTGHTPSQSGRVVSRFDNRLILIDSGMVFKGGRPSAVELLGGRITAIYPDSQTPLASGGPYSARVFRRDTFPADDPPAFAGASVNGERHAAAATLSALSRY